MRITGVTLETTQSQISENDLVSTFALPRSKMAQENAKSFPISLRDWTVHDSGALLGASATADDLGYVVGTFGTAPPTIVSSDGASTTVTQYARTQWQVPLEYQNNQTIQFVVNAEMATISDTTATIDVEVYESDKAGGIGSDLCTTAATTINSATAADKTFTINGAGLSPGDVLDIRMTVAITDGATGSGVTAQINNTEIQCDVRG